MPGKTFANVVERGYPARQLARLSLGEVRMFFLRWVVDIYHMRRHEGLSGPGGKSPLRRWQETVGDGVRMPPSMDEFTTYLGRPYKMKVDENGVVLDHLIYQSDALYAIYSRPSNRVSAREHRRYEVRLIPVSPFLGAGKAHSHPNRQDVFERRSCSLPDTLFASSCSRGLP